MKHILVRERAREWDNKNKMCSCFCAVFIHFSVEKVILENFSNKLQISKLKIVLKMFQCIEYNHYNF